MDLLDTMDAPTALSLLPEFATSTLIVVSEASLPGPGESVGRDVGQHQNLP